MQNRALTLATWDFLICLRSAFLLHPMTAAHSSSVGARESLAARLSFLALSLQRICICFESSCCVRGGGVASEGLY